MMIAALIFMGLGFVIGGPVGAIIGVLLALAGSSGKRA